MSQTLPQVAHDHHERILHHVDRMPEMADLLLTGRAGEIGPRIAETTAFLTGTLIPHMEASEATLYPELERMFQNRHSMAPMRREHAEVRRLVAEFARLAAKVEDGRLTLGRALALRRVAFQLYALLKIHLTEEDAYLRIVEHEVETEAAEVIAAAFEHPMSVA
jgi:hemerythrin-like domain-containing protein